MKRASQIEDFIPHRTPISAGGITSALTDLGASERWSGLSVPLPYTQREDGTFDTIEIGPYGGSSDWMVYLGRAYGGEFGSFNITATVGRCPGHMVVLVVRALYAHLTTVGPQSALADTVEGDILYALGLVRAEEAAR